MRIESPPSTPILPSRIEHWPLDRLIPYARNARTHSEEQIAQVAASIKEFGFTNPLLVDSKAGIIAGHCRLLAARKLGLEQVPVIVLDHLTETQKRAYLIVDNRLALNAAWDDEMLGVELQALNDSEFDLDLLGFDAEELAGYLATDEPITDEDAVLEPQEQVISVAGDLWLLGEHRLLCGNSTSKDDVKRVLNGCEPFLMVTDPPYGVELDSEWRDRAGVNKHGPAEPSYMKHRTAGHVETSISGDTKADWSDAFELLPSLEIAYVWHATSHMVEVSLGLQRIGFQVRQQLIWKKTVFTLSRQAYNWQHEPCLYAVKRGKTARWIGGYDQSTVWDAASPKAIMGGSDEEKFDHPTQKPIELMRRPILNHTKRGELVYEPFGGSGTTLVAAESTNRVCYALELDPKYCDLIVRRWQQCTGRNPTLDGDGRSFDEITQERGQS